MKLLKSILKADNTQLDKYFKALEETDADGSKIGVLFACDTKRAIVITNHGMLLPEAGIYTMVGDCPVRCSDSEDVQKMTARDHTRIMRQDAPITLIERQRVPQLKCCGREVVPVSLPNADGDNWSIGFRFEHTSINADYLPPFDEVDEIRITKPAFPVLFHKLTNDAVVVDYLVSSMEPS